MIRSVKIVPAVLTSNEADYKAQLEKINLFSHHIQIDVTDGIFVKSQTLPLNKVWWPKDWTADLHMMVAQPSKYIDLIIKMKPSLCIFHAEASEDLLPIFEKLAANGIRTGVALVRSTFPGAVERYIKVADHVMIFAGQLGVQGSSADMMQIEKIGLIRAIKAEVEIGWDGGANLINIRALAHADLDVINVGSALAKSPNPTSTYQEMVAEIDKSGVVL